MILEVHVGGWRLYCRCSAALPPNFVQSPAFVLFQQVVEEWTQLAPRASLSGKALGQDSGT